MPTVSRKPDFAATKTLPNKIPQHRAHTLIQSLRKRAQGEHARHKRRVQEVIGMGGNKNKNKESRAMTLDEAMEDLASRFVVNLTEEAESIDRCMFQVEAAHWFYDDMYRRHHRDLPFLNLKDFAMGFFKACPTLNQTEESITRALNLFQKYKRKVPVCGAIMLNNDMTRCVLVKAWGKCAAWGFPKGKIDQGESKLECAIREVEEETGYNCSENVDADEYIELSVKQQTIRLYIARDVDERTNFKTQTRKEIGDIQWIPIDGLRGGSVDIVDEASGSKKNESADDFFTGGAFLAPLTEWINSHSRVQSGKKSSKKKKKNRSRANSTNNQQVNVTQEVPAALSMEEVERQLMSSSSDSESSSKKCRKKKSSKDQTYNKDQTFGTKSKGGWSVEEMFAVNEQKFGIVNSYDESLYTTKLPDEYVQQKMASEKKRSTRKHRSSSVPDEKDRAPLPASPVLNRLESAPVFSVEQPYPLTPACTNNMNTSFAPTSMVCCASSFAPNSNASTPLPSAPGPMKFSFNRDEILKCF